MKTSLIRSFLSMSAAVLLMAACGGGADVDTSRAQGFVAQIAAAQPSAADARKRALAATEITVDAAAAFDWAEYTYPDLFPKVPAPLNLTYPYLGVIYTVRGYANGNYLGVTPGNDIYGLGPFTNEELKLLGNLSEFAAQIRADACSVHPGSCDADRASQLFDWAEYTYPALFPKGPQNADVVRDGVDYVERAYTNGNALRMTRGSADPTVYGFGPFTDNVLVSFGKWSDFAALVHADACNVYPGSCGGQTPTGTLNECTDPAVATLPTGFTSRLVYDYSGALTGEQTIETVIDGPSTFEGQSAIKITSTTSGTNSAGGIGFPITTTTKVETFEQLGSNGVTKTLGALVEVTTGGKLIGEVQIPGSTSSSKTVYNPPRENLEFHIALGETGTIVSTSTTTTIVPPGSPIGSTVTDTFTFEAKEPVTVLAGTYDTCRYRTAGENANSYTTVWYILGKGIAAQIVSTENGVETSRQQLKPGSTYNGAAL
ncbi:MAG: hypothetical protein IH627_07550 [Rubrivivax sp.]|nr:hypothetical protein [Rubrivivax sp.]